MISRSLPPKHLPEGAAVGSAAHLSVYPFLAGRLHFFDRIGSYFSSIHAPILLTTSDSIPLNP
jgi:hypothetical protein